MSDEWRAVRTAIAAAEHRRIVIVAADDDRAARIEEKVQAALGEPEAVMVRARPNRADEAFRTQRPPVVILDESVPESAREILTKLAKERNPACVVVEIQG